MTTAEPAKKRRLREDFQRKYAYLDSANMIDIRGLESLAEDLRSCLEILKNSYLAVVNSLVILNERKRKQEASSSSVLKASSSASGREASSSASSSPNFINAKVAENFRQSAKTPQPHHQHPELGEVEGQGQQPVVPVLNYPDAGYDWSIDKFCDPATRETEFRRLFAEADKYSGTVQRVRLHQEPINMARFTTLAHQVWFTLLLRKKKEDFHPFVLPQQGRSLLGITDLLNSNYSNNFLDVFRLS